jgi:DNA topoisomerase-1
MKIFYRKKVVLQNTSKFSVYFTDSKGNTVDAPELLDYFKSLVIPPNYDNVTIYYNGPTRPKILYKGYDKAGRLQVIYSKEHRLKADRQKYKDLIDFGKLLPKILSDMNHYIGQKKVTFNKLVSIIIKLITSCHFRVGNKKYLDKYNSHGITNIKVSHIVPLENDRLLISFTGKKQVKNSCTVVDPSIVTNLKNLVRDKSQNDFIFETKNISLITANDINKWIKSYNPRFQSKMFRNFYANILLIQFLNTTPLPSTTKLVKRKKALVEGLKLVSGEINNTANICKKSYINSELIQMYLLHPKRYNRMFKNTQNLNEIRVAFIKFLEKV